MKENDSSPTSTKLIEQRLAEEIRKHGFDSVKAARIRLFMFFRRARNGGWIDGLDPRRSDKDTMLQELVGIVQKKMGSTRFTEARFVEFCQNNPNRFSISSTYVRPLIEAIRETRKFKSTPQLRSLWRDVFGVEAGYLPHMLSRLQRSESGVLTTRENCKLIGDYLLLRPDNSWSVRPAFFRFYEHETLCIRSMGLRLDQAHGRLSSKGWVVRQQRGYLVSGYVIDRSDSGGAIKTDGGFSTLWVDNDVNNPLYQETDGQIAMTTVLHFQATYGLMPSSARGVLVRVKRLERKGGLYSQAPQQRNIATYRLQSSLKRRFSEELTTLEASRILSRISALPVEYFEETFEARRYIEEMLGDEDEDFVSPVAPLLPITELRKPIEFMPRDDIHFDGTQPLTSVLVGS